MRLIVVLVVGWDHEGSLTKRKLMAKQLFRSLLLSVNTFFTLDNPFPFFSLSFLTHRLLFSHISAVATKVWKIEIFMN